MPPDWLNALTCVTGSAPGPLHAPALLGVKVLVHATGLPFTKHASSVVTFRVWVPWPTAGATKSMLCADSVLRSRSEKHPGAVVSVAQAAIWSNTLLLTCWKRAS